MNQKNQILGKWGEEKAKEFLIKKGIEIIGQNEFTQYGEIDLIGKDSGTVVLFEVKTRKSKRFGYPEVSVNKKKQQHLIESALSYINEKYDLSINWRIDVISITVNEFIAIDIQWFKNAVPS